MSGSVPSSGSCPRCGTPLPSAGTHGLCPRCLMAEAMRATEPGTGPGAPGPTLPPGELAPHFPQLEILECLGRGGMGVVYKARQKSLGRLVALKLLAPERVGDATFAVRFAQEARALAALSHPGIVTIHDFGQAGGFYFLIMEFVDGVNLRQAMQAGRFTPEQALAVVPPVCEALQYAHEHGIVHRDIKPENLLLDRDGRVKIADFGIAKMLHADDPAGIPAESQPPGTAQYMAPEQQGDGPADHRADIYSLGVVLYELLTGETPGPRLQAPSSRVRGVRIDVRLDEIVLRALEAKPELRFQTAAEFRTQVDAATHPAKTGSANPEAPVSRVQQFFQAVLPRNWAAAARRESMGWHAVCPCGHAESIWARGGIRFGGAGHPRKLLWCPRCQRLSIHRLEWRGPEPTTRRPGPQPHGRPEDGGWRNWTAALLLALMGIPLFLGTVLALLFVVWRVRGGDGSPPGPALISGCVFLVGVCSVLLLRWLGRRGLRPGPGVSRAGRAMGLGLLLLAAAWGGTRLLGERQVHAARRTQLAHEYQTGQEVRTRAETGEAAARAAARRLQAAAAQAPDPADRTRLEREAAAQALQADTLARSAATARDRSDETSVLVDRLHFPNAASVMRALFPSAPLLVVGLFLVLRPGAARTRPSEAAPRTWKGRTGLALGSLGGCLALFGLWALAQIANDPDWNPSRGEAILTTGSWILAVAFAVAGLALVRSDQPAGAGSGSRLRQAWREMMPGLAALAVAFATARFLARLEASSPGALEQFLAAPTPVVKFGYVPVGVSNNVVIVKVEMDVQRTPAEIRVGFAGNRLPAGVEESLPEAFQPPFHGTFVKPLPHAGNDLRRILPVGRQTWRLGFVLPDAAMARKAWEHLQPGGRQPGAGDRRVADTLFDVRDGLGERYVASLAITPVLSSGDPRWVSVLGQASHNESVVDIRWEILGSRPGLAGFSRAGTPIVVLQPRQSHGTKLFGIAARLTLTRLSNHRVLLVTEIRGSQTSEEFDGNFHELSAELLRTASFSARTVVNSTIELCQFQGTSFTVQVTPSEVPGTSSGWSGESNP